MLILIIPRVVEIIAYLFELFRIKPGSKKNYISDNDNTDTS